MLDMLAVNACLCALHLSHPLYPLGVYLHPSHTPVPFTLSFILCVHWCPFHLFLPFTHCAHLCHSHPHTPFMPAHVLMSIAPAYTCSCPSGPLEYPLYPLMLSHTHSHSSLGLMPLSHHIFIVDDCQYLLILNRFAYNLHIMHWS